MRRRYHSLPLFPTCLWASPRKQKDSRLVVESYASGSLRAEFRLPVVVTCNLRRSALFEDTLAHIEQAGLSGVFQFTGYVREEDLPLIYAAAQALLPIPRGTKVLACHRWRLWRVAPPSSALNRTSLPEVVGDAALMVDPEQPASLTEALGKVNDGPTRREMAKQGLDRAELSPGRARRSKLLHTSSTRASVLSRVRFDNGGRPLTRRLACRGGEGVETVSSPHPYRKTWFLARTVRPMDRGAARTCSVQACLRIAASTSLRGKVPGRQKPGPQKQARATD